MYGTILLKMNTTSFTNFLRILHLYFQCVIIIDDIYGFSFLENKIACIFYSESFKPDIWNPF